MFFLRSLTRCSHGRLLCGGDVCAKVEWWEASQERIWKKRLQREGTTCAKLLLWVNPGFWVRGRAEVWDVRGIPWQEVRKSQCEVYSALWSPLLLGLILAWRRRWQPTPVFLPGESHGWRSLVGYSPRVAKNLTWLSDFIFTLTFTSACKRDFPGNKTVLQVVAQVGRLYRSCRVMLGMTKLNSTVWC